MNIVSSILMLLLNQFPVIAVWIIGLIVSLVFLRRYPQVSLISLIAMIGFLAILLVDTYLNIRLPIIFQERGLSPAQMSFSYSMKNHIFSLISAVIWVLLGSAIFGWRSQQGLSGNGEVEPAKDAKIHWSGKASLFLSVSLALIIIASLIRIGFTITVPGDSYSFFVRLIDSMNSTLYFPLWSLPLGILNVILSVIALKKSVGRQKKTAGLGIAVGTLAIASGLWLSIYLFLFIISVY